MGVAVGCGVSVGVLMGVAVCCEASVGVLMGAGVETGAQETKIIAKRTEIDFFVFMLLPLFVKNRLTASR